MAENLAIIVEDDEDVASFLSQAAREAGYVTHVVHDGEAAVSGVRTRAEIAALGEGRR